MSATSPLVSIPDCKATQLLGPAQTDLGHGTLLALADPASPDSLLIQVGSAAFALTAASKFYTHVDDARQYYFPADSGEAVGSGSYVQLTLPADVSTAGSETQRLRDTFEDALLARGFLRAGPFAAADELGRSIAQDGTANAAALSSAAQTHIDAADGRDLAVPEVLKDIAVSAKDGTAKVQGYTAAGAEAIGSAAQAAGAKAAAYLPAMPSGGGDSDLAQKARALYADASEAVGTLTSGVADGSSALGTASVDSTHDIVRHDLGSEASNVADNAGLAAANTGKIANDLTMGTSTIFHGAKAAEGASQGQ